MEKYMIMAGRIISFEYLMKMDNLISHSVQEEQLRMLHSGGAITDAPFGASLVNNDGIYFTKMATSPFKATIKKYTLEGDVETDFGNSGTVVNTISTMNTNILGWNGVQYGADFIADDLFLYGKYMDTLCFLKYNADGILNSTYGQSGISKRTLAEIFPAGYSYQVRTVFVLNNQWHVQVSMACTSGWNNKQ